MTEKVAVCPTVTLWLAGWVAIIAAVEFGGASVTPDPAQPQTRAGARNTQLRKPGVIYVRWSSVRSRPHSSAALMQKSGPRRRIGGESLF